MRHDLRHLSTFVAVAEELNFHRAAERLTMAQPAVSRIVQELEHRLGVRLFERTTRRVRLTEAGRYLLTESQDVLARVDAAEITARLLASGTKAILRIGYTTIGGHALVPDIVRSFRSSDPEVRLELTYMTSPMQRDRILQDEIDLGFIDGSFQSTEIESCLVARHGLMALLPPGHPLAAQDALTVEDIAGETLVMGTRSEWPTFRRFVVEVFQSAGHVLHAAQEASSLTGILGLVTAGVGVTLFCGVPRFCVGGAIVARPVLTDRYIETHLAWRRAGLSSAIHRFIEASQRVSESHLRR